MGDTKRFELLNSYDGDEMCVVYLIDDGQGSLSATISGDSSVIIPEGVVLTVNGTAYTDCVLTADSL